MKQLIKKTNRNVLSHRGYGGVCHQCNSPIAYDGELVCIEIENTETYYRVVPIDVFVCPYCNETIQTIMIYKNLEVSGEFVKHE